MKKQLLITLTLLLSSILLRAGGFAGGSGTQTDPYLVATAHHLNEVRNHPDKYFLQIADINLNVAPYNMGNYWVPIGGNRHNNQMNNNFTGHYNGNGFIISNLTIVQPGNMNVGLFGHIGQTGDGATTIINVHLKSVTVIGGTATGALVGRVTGNQNTRIENCSVELGYVRGDAAVGGLVGTNNSFMATSLAAEGYRPVIFNCSANVSVFLRSEYSQGKTQFGGLVGCNQKGMISNSFALGDVIADDQDASYIGGLTGCIAFRGIVINSYSAVAIHAHEASHKGGFTGYIGVGRNQGMVVNSYWNTDLNTDQELNSLGASGLTTSQMQTQGSYMGWNFNTMWTLHTEMNLGFPIFQSEAESLKVLRQWTGASDSLWTNAANWSPEGVPGAADKAVIAAGTEYYPVIMDDVSVNDLVIQDNAQLVLLGEESALTITGSLAGSDESIGNALVRGEGYLVMEGDNLQSIPAMVFENLVINNVNNVQLAGSIWVNGLLKMGQGLLDLRGFEINLGEKALLQETENDNFSSRVYGSSGVIRTQRYLDKPQGEIGGMGLEISSNENFGMTLIERGHSELNGGDDSKSIHRWFHIEPANNQDLDATLVFHYFISELNVYGENDNFSLFKRKTGDNEWIWVPSELDPFNQVLTAHNVDAFSTWTAGSTDNPLPIVLLSFEGRQVDDLVELSWVTLAEINNDFFTIERSANGIDFEPLATVAGAGTTSQSHHYKLADEQPLSGVAYYRLKQTDFNGDFEYSQVISVYTEAVSGNDIRIYPNPSNGNFNILMGGEMAMEFQVIDMQGRPVYRSVANGGQVSNVSLPQLPQGIYTVVFFGNETFTKKVQVF